jgi:hypothetical protein
MLADFKNKETFFETFVVTVNAVVIKNKKQYN